MTAKEMTKRFHEITSAAFDGHTEFAALNFTQKLIWLSEAAVSVYVLAQCNPSAGCNAFFERRTWEIDPPD